MNERSEMLKAKGMAWVKKYKRFHDEVTDYELETMKSFSMYNFIIYEIYGIICLVWNRYVLDKSILGAVLCFAVGAFSLTDYVVCRFFLEKNRKYVVITTEIYIMLLIKTLLALDLQWNELRGGNVLWTLMVCSIIMTSMICIVPHHYAIVIIAVAVLDIIEAVISCFTLIDILYNVLDSVVIAIFCIGVNIIFSKHHYIEFARKEELKYENSRDMLTQLYNRRFIERYYGLHAATETMCAIIMLDLDNFKKANDTYGHEMGDEVLCQTSDILRRYFRGNDCVARLGGDEFAVFLQGVSNIDVIVERIHKLLGEFPIVLDENVRVEVSVSIGIAFKNSGEDIEYSKLCNKADEAMYIAKRMGKGKAVICPERNVKDMIVVA